MKKVRLGELATYINGYAFKPADWVNKGLPIIRIQNLTGSSQELNYYDGEYPLKTEINNGDVLISWSASLGVHIWNKGKALLNQHIFKVLFDKMEVDKKYFVYAVKHNLSTMESHMHGATMKHIIKKDFDNILVPYPSLERQEKIAKVLTNLEKILESKNLQLQSYEQLIKSRFVEMFGDISINSKSFDIKPFGDLCFKIGDGLHGTPLYDDKGNYYFINGNNLGNDCIKITETTKKVNEEVFKKYYIQFGENTVFLSINGTLGNVALYNDEPIILGKSAAYCNLKPSLHIKFVAELFKTNEFKEYMLSNSSGTTITNFGLKAFRNYPMIVPPMILQTQFTKFVEQVDKLKFEVDFTYHNYRNIRLVSKKIIGIRL